MASGGLWSSAGFLSANALLWLGVAAIVGAGGTRMLSIPAQRRSKQRSVWR